MERGFIIQLVEKGCAKLTLQLQLQLQLFSQSYSPEGRMSSFARYIKEISEEDNKLVENYLRELYNKHLFNATNKQNGGKKSRKQKNKKRNTLKRGGTWVDVYDTAQYIVMIGFIGASVLLCILKREEDIAKRRNNEYWANNDDRNYPM